MSPRIAILALLAAAGFTTAAGAAELRPAVTVSGETVTLGDIFEGAGNAASVVVAPAPAPGARAEISVSRISLAARRNGIDWRNEAGLTHIVIGRNGVAVPDGDVAAAISSAIEAQSSALPASSALQVDFANGMAGIQVADGDEPTVKVEQISFNRRSGAFTAILRAPADDMLSPLRRVAGRAYPVTDVPVLTRDMQPGEVVRQNDIDWVRLPSNRVGQNVITSLEHLVGMSPRRPARAGEPMRVADMQPPIVVGKGTQVDMSFVSGALTLTARGRALESGAVGDVVGVLNIRSNRTVQGVVEGPNMVRIDAPGAARAASLARSGSPS